jgi:hypothetical protein
VTIYATIVSMLASRRVSRLEIKSPEVMKARDALIKFECYPGSVKVIETVNGTILQRWTTLQELDVVSELEEKYIFFGDEAEIARKLIQRGRSCVLSVYFREP